MPFNQPQTNNYFGFQPVSAGGGDIQCNPYIVSSSATAGGTAFYMGDLVVQTTVGSVRPLSSGGPGIATSSMALIGVAAQYFPALAGSTAATLGSSQMVMVWDNPNQFYMVCDTTSGVIGSNEGLFKNYAVLTTGAAGTSPSSYTGLSNQAISGLTATMAGAFHVITMHPMEKGIHSTVGAVTAGSAVNVRKWIGKLVGQVQAIPANNVLSVQNTTS